VKNSNLAMIYVMVIVSVVAAFLLTYTYEKTKSKIAEAYRAELVRALDKVLPPHDNKPDVDKIEIEGNSLYLAKKNGNLVGYAMKSVSHRGYSGDIDIIVGIDKDGKVYGIEILRHAETPGLGSKIEEDWFKNEFKGLDVTSNIKVKKDGGIIDQFSGATISPRAVCEAVSLAVRFVSEKVLHNPQLGGGK